MLGDDPTRRFDYLFEPIDGGDTVENTDDDGAFRKPDADRPRLAAPARLIVAAILLATVAASVAILMLLLHPEHGDEVNPQVGSVPAPTRMSASPVATTQPAPIPPPVTTSVVDTAVVQSTTVETTAVPAPQAPLEPTTAAPISEAPVIGPPPTRAPISVEPEPRAPFPNQEPPYGSDDRGGLLGGGGLL
jgi:hypothetical protein